MKFGRIASVLLVLGALVFFFSHYAAVELPPEANEVSQTEIASSSGVSSKENSQVESSELNSEPTPGPEPEPESDSAIDSFIQQMSLEEKVGQLFVVRPDALDFNQTVEQINDAAAEGVTEMSNELTAALHEYPVGGIAMFGKNIEEPAQIQAFITSLLETAKIPLFIAVDEEGGAVSRLANNPAFELKTFESAAAINDTDGALAMGQTIGSYLREYGFNLDFAPVADMNTNPDNPVIGTRAFSSDADIVTAMAAAMADGLRSQGITPTFKHFPGHGDTAEDSHSGLAISNKTQAELETCEWLPYQSLSAQCCVMVGHIALPNVTDSLTPASMDERIVTQVLRRQLDFRGVVITDSLSMQAITDTYDSAEAAISAIQAGCDILLMPQDFRTAYAAVLTAVKNGEISEERLNESVERILTLKMDYGIIS